MKVGSRFVLLGILAVALLVGGGLVLAVTGPEIGWDLIGSGGGPMGSGVVELRDAMGQPIIGPSEDGGVAIGAGFAYGAMDAAPQGTPTPTQTIQPGVTHTPTSTSTIPPGATQTPTPTSTTPPGATATPTATTRPGTTITPTETMPPGTTATPTTGPGPTGTPTSTPAHDIHLPVIFKRS